MASFPVFLSNKLARGLTVKHGKGLIAQRTGKRVDVRACNGLIATSLPLH